LVSTCENYPGCLDLTNFKLPTIQLVG